MAKCATMNAIFSTAPSTNAVSKIRKSFVVLVTRRTNDARSANMVFSKTKSRKDIEPIPLKQKEVIHKIAKNARMKRKTNINAQIARGGYVNLAPLFVQMAVISFATSCSECYNAVLCKDCGEDNGRCDDCKDENPTEKSDEEQEEEQEEIDENSTKSNT